MTVARTWTFPAGSVVVADRVYLDFGWLHRLQEQGVTLVTRLKRGVKYRVLRDHDVDIRAGVMSDQTIELTSARGRKAYPGTLRRVGYWDAETKQRYVFVTNNTKWVGKTIADLYKSRWQIELFFKWIKQYLKVKRFVGRSKNAVLTQLWVATCMYLLLAYLKFVLRLSWTPCTECYEFSNSTCSTAVHRWSCSCLLRHRVPRTRRCCCGAENACIRRYQVSLTRTSTYLAHGTLVPVDVI